MLPTADDRLAAIVTLLAVAATSWILFTALERALLWKVRRRMRQVARRHY